MDDGRRSSLKGSARATLSLISLCLIMLIGSPAGAQSESGGRLGPQDTVEIRVSGWTALRGGVAEASILTDAFTIGTTGSLELPLIGHVPAAGLRADELAKLIADRLQARSGLPERPVTTVQLKQYPPLVVRGSVVRPGKYPYRPNLTVQEAIESAGGLAGIEDTETQLSLSISRSVGRVRKLAVVQNTLVLPGDVISVRRTPVPETRSARMSTDRSSVGASHGTNTEERQLAAQPSMAGSRAEQQQALDRERSRAEALLRDLSATRHGAEAVRKEAEAARKETLAARQAARDAAVRYNLGLVEARQRGTTLTQELSAARADLEAAKAQVALERNAASRARQAAEILANEQHELVARERAKSAVQEQSLVAARREIEVLKNKQQTTGDEREQALRRELMAAREQLDSMRGDASASARAVADTTALQARALEEQRQRAERLAGDLTVAQREVEGLKAHAVIAIREKVVAHRAHHAVETSLAEARRALDEERHKVERFERDLVAARQSIDALEASANLAAAAQATALQGRQVAEAALRRVGEALAQERGRAVSAARDLDSARKERDATKQELTRVSAELLAALEQERDKVIDLARDVSVARKEIDMLKARGERRIARIEPAPKPRASQNQRVSVQVSARPARQLGSREIRKVEVRKPLRPVRLTTISLPSALLPVQ